MDSLTVSFSTTTSSHLSIEGVDHDFLRRPATCRHQFYNFSYIENFEGDWDQTYGTWINTLIGVKETWYSWCTPRHKSIILPKFVFENYLRNQVCPTKIVFCATKKSLTVYFSFNGSVILVARTENNQHDRNKIDMAWSGLTETNISIRKNRFWKYV